MIHNHEKLLIKLVEQYYGTIPSLTAKVLVQHGALLMKRALSYSQLKKSDFLKGLDLLVRCKFVKITKIKKQSLLEIFNKKLVNILYYPYYLFIINKRFGIESGSLLKILLLYGNLSINELIERTLYHIIQTNSLDIVEEQTKFFISSLYEKYKELFNKKIILLVTEKDSLEEDDYDLNLIYASLKKKFVNNGNVNNVKDYSSKSVLSFNSEALDCYLFIELFPYFLNQPFPNEEVSYLFNLLLELTYEKSFAMRSTLLTYQEIFVKYSSKYPNVNISRLSTTLNMFSHFFAPNFIQIEKNGCSLNFEIFLNDIVKIITKEFVKKNFGENSVKIFGSLLEDVCIYENNLLNSLKIDSKELHRNLYHLDQNRMININFFSEPNQSSTFSARNIKKTFSVNLNDVVDYTLKRCYYSLYTIMHRRHIEMNDQKDLISRKNHIEIYKKEIEKQVENEEEKGYLIKTAHNYMSENDHKRADSLLSYDTKVNQIEYNLISYIFVLNLWKSISDSDKHN